MATTGLWNIGGINLPDWGLTEKFTTWQANPKAVQTYGAPASYPGTTTGMQSIPGGTMSTLGPNVVKTPGTTFGAVNSPFTTPTSGSNPSGGSPSGGSPSGGSPSGGETSSGPSAEDILRSQVASIFDPVFSALAGQENTLQTNYGITQSQIGGQYDTAGQNLLRQKQQGMNQLGQLETTAGKTKQDAWTQAVRLYNELTRGGQQRYGGASSAGEAFNTLTSVEQQRRQGAIQSAYDTALQQVAQYKADLESQFEQNNAQLEGDRLAALRDAQKAFNDAWQQIQNNKATAQSDKARATMDTLNDYRNKVYTINMQAAQAAMDMAANKQIALSTVDKYVQQALNSVTGGTNTVASFGGLASNAANATNYGNLGIRQTAAPSYVGTISPTKRYDPNDPSTW